MKVRNSSKPKRKSTNNNRDISEIPCNVTYLDIAISGRNKYSIYSRKADTLSKRGKT